MTSKILIVDDEHGIVDMIQSYFQSQYDILTAYSGQEALQKAGNNPDLILLDINLPEQDGYRLCSAIRSFSQTPILFITGRDTAMDELQALTIGGDDYITKPYNIPILLARISILLRHGAAEQPDCLEYNGIKLNAIAGTLTAGEKEIELTKTELKIMYYLFKHPREIVSRLDLVEYLWDSEIHIDDNLLSVNIMRIREKLRDLGIDNLIQTKRGMGYRI